jgi:hypothetical protein
MILSESEAIIIREYITQLQEEVSRLVQKCENPSFMFSWKDSVPLEMILKKGMEEAYRMGCQKTLNELEDDRR